MSFEVFLIESKKILYIFGDYLEGKMKNFGKKIVFFAAISFFSFLFAENGESSPCCALPTPPTQICPGQDPCCPDWPTPLLNAAYNYPAIIKTRSSWNVHTDASFIYWQPFQENMEPFLISSIPNTVTLFDGYIPRMNFDYKSGFKVGIGVNFDHDHWDSYAGYTWFHGTDTITASVNPADQAIIPLLGPPGLFSTTSVQYFAEGRSQWRLKMDLVDWDLGRNYYVGTHLLFRPALGIRGAWIRQNRTATFSTAPPESSEGSAVIYQNWFSWGVGPRGSLNTQWQLGRGFRLYGIGAADLLYTYYTQMKETGIVVSPTGTLLSNIGMNQKLNMLRTHLELELGVAWNTYFNCNKWYLDFSLGYVFHDFLHQRLFLSIVSTSGDLFIHGLTATLNLGF